MGRKAKLKRGRKSSVCGDAVAKQIVKQANQTVDPMDAVTSFRIFSRNNLQLGIIASRALDLELAIRDWAFVLTKNNMKTFYEDSEWGWSDDEKSAELNHPAAWYLLATKITSGDPQAFVHFRFDVDFGVPVLYCYEIQLEEAVQRKGLGKFLMQILQLIALKMQLQKVILTVFKHNFEALAFYRNGLNFQVDNTSPSVTGDTECYEILSKTLKRK